MWQHSHDSSSCDQRAGCDTNPCLFVFVSSSDFKSSARCPRWKTLAEDQQNPGDLRHHVDLLQPWHGDGLLGDSRGCLFKPLAVWHSAQRRSGEAACTAAVSDAEHQNSPVWLPSSVPTKVTQDVNDYCSWKKQKVMVWCNQSCSGLLLGTGLGRRRDSCLKELAWFFFIFFTFQYHFFSLFCVIFIIKITHG